ncbi:MAG: PIN-like domain-containing protein [Cyclobacteriaceae bacterium]
MNFESSYFELDEIDEEKLFKTAYIFFDTSALLDFYYFSDASKNEIFDKVFSQLQGRLWISKQTEFEFVKNKSKVSNKLFNSYIDLLKKSNNNKDSGYIEEIHSTIDNIKNQSLKNLNGLLRTLTERTAKNEKHPFLERNSFEVFSKSFDSLVEGINSFNDRFLDFKKAIELEVEKKRELLQSNESEDIVLKKFDSFFQVTSTSSYSEILEIIAEGELRLRNQIPPGYLDFEDKIGFQKYGDLIVWKQLVKQCSADKKNAILVTNDLSEDWWHFQQKKNSGAPRYELIKEFNDLANAKFWMFDINSFLFKAKRYVASGLKDNTIEEAKNVVSPKYKVLANESDSDEPDNESRVLRSSYVVIAYQSNFVKDSYARRVHAQLNNGTELNDIKPILLSPLLRRVFKSVEIGDIIYFSKNFAYNEIGHFAGFRKDDLGITIPYAIRRSLNVSKGKRYTVQVDGVERRITFISR